jgi:predicted dehydrogenase
MFKREQALPRGERMDCVSIVTPNHMHYPVAKLALEHGFHVICDKPLCLNLKEARALAALVRKTGLIFALTHNYTGYPMVKEARAWVRSGKLGRIRKIVAEYPQGWLASLLEATGQKQADWRTDPKRAGASCCMGDIGSHAENLVEYITGLQIESVCADLTTFVKGRKLDDDGSVLLRFTGGARGLVSASQISIDEENALAIRIYGEKGGLEWHQEEPNTLMLKWPDQPRQYLRTGGYAHLSAAARQATRLPAGHPEGYLEAFGNIYRSFATAVRIARAGKKRSAAWLDFPTVADGVRGMAFIETVVKSSQSKQKWVKMPVL